MQEETSTGSLAHGTQTIDVTLEINLRRVAQDELHRSWRAGLPGQLAMGLDDVRMTHVLAVHQPINRFAIAPRFGLVGRAAVGATASGVSPEGTLFETMRACFRAGGVALPR